MIYQLILNLLYKHTKKEELENDILYKTKFPKRFKIFSLVVLVLFLTFFIIGCILISIFDRDFPFSSWIAFVISCFFIFLVPLFLTIYSFCTYEIIKEDGFVISRLFKRKFIAYTEISYFEYEETFNQLTVFNYSNKSIFCIGDNRVGIKSVLKHLRKKGIIQKF